MMTKQAFWNDPKVVRTFAGLKAPLYWEEFFSKLSNSRDIRVLDLGCGGGRITVMLWEKGFDVYACDYSPAMVGATRKRISELTGKAHDEKIFRVDMKQLPFEDGAFTHVVANGVYHNADSEKEVEGAFGETARVLERGGTLCLNMFCGGFIDKDLKKDETVPHRFFTKEGLSMMLLPPDVIRSLLEGQGLRKASEPLQYRSGVLTGTRYVFRGIFMRE